MPKPSTPAAAAIQAEAAIREAEAIPAAAPATPTYPSSNPNGPYTGGQLVLTSGTEPPYTLDYSLSSGRYGEQYYTNASANGATETASADASGTISYTYTWNGGPDNLPPPSCLIKEETCTVEYGAGGADATGSGSYANPLDGSGSEEPTSPGAPWTVTQYSVVNDPGATYTDSLQGAYAQSQVSVLPAGYGDATAGVFDAVSLSVPTITLAAPAQLDTSGNWDILIGQWCQPTLTGLPSGNGWSTSNWQWSVSDPGDTFQYWKPVTNNANPPQANGMTSYQGGPGTLNVQSPGGWYWDNQGNGQSFSETITCTVTVTPPTGTSFTVTVSQPVNVYIPTWYATGVAGYMQVNTKAPSDYDYELWAGP